MPIAELPVGFHHAHHQGQPVYAVQRVYGERIPGELNGLLECEPALELPVFAVFPKKTWKPIKQRISYPTILLIGVISRLASQYLGFYQYLVLQIQMEVKIQPVVKELHNLCCCC